MKRAVRGIEKVLLNLNAELSDKIKRSMAGVLAAGHIIEREAKRRVPREYGNLHGSGYARKAQDGSTAVEIGFSSAYALWVHENLEMKLKGKDRPSGLGKYWGPSGEAKYLENSLRDKKQEAFDMIAKYAAGSK